MTAISVKIGSSSVEMCTSPPFPVEGVTVGSGTWYFLLAGGIGICTGAVGGLGNDCLIHDFIILIVDTRALAAR